MKKTTPGTVLEEDTGSSPETLAGQGVTDTVEADVTAGGDGGAAVTTKTAVPEADSVTDRDTPVDATPVAAATPVADPQPPVDATPAAGSDRAGTGRSRRLLRGGVAALAVLLIVATVFAVVFGWKLHDRNRVDDAARGAEATAQTYAVTLTSIDAQHIDENFTDVLNGATGDFKDMYSQSSTQLKALLVQNKAVSKGRVVNASILSASENQVVVMLFVDQEVTNSASPDPRIDRSRILMTMQRVGGKWLAAKVEMV
ncbi:hypothetical protein [Nocardia sp. alder85J]|uniref:hypothetical protein n=1 Tax=Nocardia sp. alder85J TaxID=2862949 RepID=UPI001CD2ACA2|nr:hypothetical protein [Nocardia sp. alder85J]MCX4095207.1 hypothetical protein [Nocardia sp. alder85J]